LFKALVLLSLSLSLSPSLLVDSIPFLPI
jgi:hypothetical protein